MTDQPTPQVPPPRPPQQVASGRGCWYWGGLIGCSGSLGLIALVVGVFVVLHGQVEDGFQEYLAELQASSEQEIRASFHEELSGKLMAPEQLAGILKQLPTHYGPYEGVAALGWNTSTEWNFGRTTRRLEGTVQFQQAEIPLAFDWWDGKLAGIEGSDGPALADLIAANSKAQEGHRGCWDRGELFLRALCEYRPAEAEELMSQALKDAVEPEGVEGVALHLAGSGVLKDIRLMGDRVSLEHESVLVVDYRLVFESEELDCEVHFQFQGLDIGLIAFQYKEVTTGGRASENTPRVPPWRR